MTTGGTIRYYKGTIPIHYLLEKDGIQAVVHFNQVGIWEENMFFAGIGKIEYFDLKGLHLSSDIIIRNKKAFSMQEIALSQLSLITGYGGLFISIIFLVLIVFSLIKLFFLGIFICFIFFIISMIVFSVIDKSIKKYFINIPLKKGWTRLMHGQPYLP